MKIKSVKIDKERCIGCGSCAALAPAAFTVDIEESKVGRRSLLMIFAVPPPLVLFKQLP
jgi:ferredoxin